MKNTSMSFVVLLALAGCGGGDGTAASDEAATTHEAETAGDEQQGAPEPARVLADGTRLFGAELSERDATPLTTILGDPSTYAGQVVKTSGEISAVCQSMGCWMELRVDAQSPGIRVPMANHAFFLPRDLTGARATIEGTVSVAAVDEATREHLESEGAQAAASELSIEATGVLVHPPDSP